MLSNPVVKIYRPSGFLALSISDLEHWRMYWLIIGEFASGLLIYYHRFVIGLLAIGPMSRRPTTIQSTLYTLHPSLQWSDYTIGSHLLIFIGMIRLFRINHIWVCMSTMAVNGSGQRQSAVICHSYVIVTVCMCVTNWARILWNIQF